MADDLFVPYGPISRDDDLPLSTLLQEPTSGSRVRDPSNITFIKHLKIPDRVLEEIKILKARQNKKLINNISHQSSTLNDEIITSTSQLSPGTENNSTVVTPSVTNNTSTAIGTSTTSTVTATTYSTDTSTKPVAACPTYGTCITTTTATTNTTTDTTTDTTTATTTDTTIAATKSVYTLAATNATTTTTTTTATTNTATNATTAKTDGCISSPAGTSKSKRKRLNLAAVFGSPSLHDENESEIKNRNESLVTESESDTIKGVIKSKHWSNAKKPKAIGTQSALSPSKPSSQISTVDCREQIKEDIKKLKGSLQDRDEMVELVAFDSEKSRALDHVISSGIKHITSAFWKLQYENDFNNQTFIDYFELTSLKAEQQHLKYLCELHT